MNSRAVLCEAFCLTLAMALVTGCGGAPIEPAATSAAVLPSATATPVRPTETPTVIPLTPTPIGGGSGRIAFDSSRDGNREIYVMNADGSAQTNLTSHEADDERPSMSPDGARIVFRSDRDENWEIYLINTDGSGLTRLTDTSGWEDCPVWSPDGKHIAFVREFDLWVMDPDGSNQASLSGEPWAESSPILTWNGAPMPGADLYPAWLSDGIQLIFLSVRDRSFQYYTVNLDGTGLEILDSGLPPSEFASEQMVYLIPTGLDQNYLTAPGAASQPVDDTGSALGEFPAWSPDGTRIAFHSDRDGNMEIYVASADRSGIARLTQNDAVDVYPTWSPDSTRIAFVSDRDGNLEIYVMKADGTEQTRLTDNSATDLLPSWQ